MPVKNGTHPLGNDIPSTASASVVQSGVNRYCQIQVGSLAQTGEFAFGLVLVQHLSVNFHARSMTVKLTVRK